MKSAARLGRTARLRTKTTIKPKDDAYFAELERRIRRVFAAHPALPNQLKEHPWSIGALGDPFAGIWFMAENPAASRVASIGKREVDRASRELQFAESAGDHLFRDALVRHRFKDAPGLAPGGWHCYVTDLLKSPVIVSKWQKTKRVAKRETLARWVPVLRWELEQTKPRMIVLMGRNVQSEFRRLLREGIIRYDGQLHDITHYAYVGNRPEARTRRRAMHPLRVRAYHAEFRTVASQWRSLPAG